MTDRDMRFVDEYMVDFDAKNAAIRAGYAPATARNAYAWINSENGATPTKPRVRAEIDKRMAELSRRTGITAERVMMELARIAFADITDVADIDSCKVIPQARRADTAAIASVRVKKGDDWTEREVKLYDKSRALELIGKRLGMFTDNVKLTGPLPVIVDDCDGGQK